MEYKVHLYYGDGKGKTCSATGRAIRMLGNGGKVCYTQFLKDGSSNEIGIIKSIPGVDYLCVGDNYGFTWLMDEREKAIATAQYTQLLDLAVEKATSGNVEMLVLDEVLDLIVSDLVSEEYIIRCINNIKGKAEIIITGHTASENVMALADYITLFNNVKHPYDEGVPARRGIEY